MTNNIVITYMPYTTNNTEEKRTPSNDWRFDSGSAAAKGERTQVNTSSRSASASGSARSSTWVNSRKWLGRWA